MWVAFEAELTGEHGHLCRAVGMHSQQQGTLSQLLEGACLAFTTASLPHQWATAHETRVRHVDHPAECKQAAAQSYYSSHRCPQPLRHGVSPHRYVCNSTSTVQAHFMLKLVSSILMGMRPFAKPLR